MSRDLRNRLLIILGVLVACVFFAFPINEKINLGLDLKGGMHLILQVETEKLDEAARDDAVLRGMEILRNRIDGLGVGETVIQRQGMDKILVQLPGVTDRDNAIDIVKRVAHLEFKWVADDQSKLTEAIEGNVPAGLELKEIKKDSGNEQVLLEKNVVMKGDAVSDARVDFDQMSGYTPKISLSFTGAGSKRFAQLTRDGVGRRLAIILDNDVMSAPNINEPILSGSAEISGQFKFEEANMLALALRSGSLPAPMRIEEERTVGPLLGQESINAGIQATLIGVTLVLLFMVIYYQIGGLIASIALVLNIFLILGFMGFLSWSMPASPMTLTLPGIAGIILTLGMAVDANVLIQERIREELELGQSVAAAVKGGFNKAFSAIIDSNLTTLIAAFMLFQFGSGPIKGFAVTLSIGLVASLFTALFVARTFFDVLIKARWIKSLPMLRLFKNTNFDFISKRFICFAISIVLLGAGMFSLISKGSDAYGIDFAGGQVQEYHFKDGMTSEGLRDMLNAGGVEDVSIQAFSQHPGNLLIRTAADTYDSVKAALIAGVGENGFEILRVEKVGPVVGEALRKGAMFAMLFALGGILIFVGFRFKHFDFAAAGIVAILHDVLITMGLIVLMGREIDLLVVTALLTIAGYSINDTIIIYDRVRENQAKGKKMALKDVLNLSVNQTLGRTILTTITTMLVVVTLFLKGGEVLNTFALCLMIGFIAGTYSTVFIASPIVLFWANRGKKKLKQA